MFLGQEVHYYMVYIAYFTELILQICDYAQKRRILRENCKYAFDEKFHGHFCSRRKPAKFCHPDTDRATPQTLVGQIVEVRLLNSGNPSREIMHCDPHCVHSLPV